MCMNVTSAISYNPVDTSLYDKYYKNKILQTSYLLHATNALVDRSGAVLLECGEWGSKDIADLRWTYVSDWATACRNSMKQASLSHTTMLKLVTDKYQYTRIIKCLTSPVDGRPIILPTKAINRYPRVFVITASFDENFQV